MTWTRLDDHWTRREVFLDLPYEVRWHYLCMIEYCSVNNRYDGQLRAIEATRCSDVLDSEGAIRRLVAADLVRECGPDFTLVQIAEHVPPPYLRDEARKERQKENKRRSRLHARGDHSECLPEKCPRAVDSESSPSVLPSSHVLSRPGVTSDLTGDTLSESERWEREWGSEAS